MRAAREYLISGSNPSEVIDCLVEWLQAYEFILEDRRGFSKKSLGAKTVQRVGEFGTDSAGNGETLEIFFEFVASKASCGAILQAEYYGIRPLGGGRQETDITANDISTESSANHNRYFLVESAKSLVGAFEEYFGLKEGKASEWHDPNVDFDLIDGKRIRQVLTANVKNLREIAKELGIHRIADIRKIHRKLVSLSKSKPEVVGGWYGFRVTGGYSRHAPILEGSFWRRDCEQ